MVDRQRADGCSVVGCSRRSQRGPGTASSNGGVVGLAGVRLSYNVIAELDRDVSVDGESVWIGGRHRIRIEPHEVTDFQPVEVWERWCTVLQFSDRCPSTALLVEQLQRDTFPDMTGFVGPRRSGRGAIDRWGHLPFPAAPMTAAEIGAAGFDRERNATAVDLRTCPARHRLRPSWPEPSALAPPPVSR